MQETLAELDSDHAPVKITLNSTSQSYQYNNSLIKGKPNWDIYSNQIKTNLKIPNSIPSIQAAEQISEHLITVITGAAQACFKPKKTHNYSQNIGFIPHFILSLIRQKHFARRNWQIQRNSATKKLLNQLTKKVKIALQNHRVSSYNNYLSNMHPGDTNLWKASKRLLNQEINTIPPFRKDNQLVTSDAKKCNVFSEMLFNTFSVNQISNTNNDRRVLNFLDLPDYSI
jgi:hypothetical protein